jgi:hypothetical protein
VGQLRKRIFIRLEFAPGASETTGSLDLPDTFTFRQKVAAVYLQDGRTDFEVHVHDRTWRFEGQRESHHIHGTCLLADEKGTFSIDCLALKAAGHLPESGELRQVKSLNTLIEQDHRFIKRLTKPGTGFFSFATAWRTFQGYEVMNMMRKGQVQGVAKGEVRGQVALVAKLFGGAI